MNKNIFYAMYAMDYHSGAQLETDAPLPRNRDMNVVLSINGLAMIALFLFPGSLVSLCTAAVG